MAHDWDRGWTWHERKMLVLCKKSNTLSFVCSNIVPMFYPSLLPYLSFEAAAEVSPPPFLLIGDVAEDICQIIILFFNIIYAVPAFSKLEFNNEISSKIS